MKCNILKKLYYRSEIEDLEQKVSREREKYQLSTQEDSIGISTIPPLNIKDKVLASFQPVLLTPATIKSSPSKISIPSRAGLQSNNIFSLWEER